MSSSSQPCASCLMPLHKDPAPSGSDQYCSFCYKDGQLCYQGHDLKVFQAQCYQGMRARGMNIFLAKLFTWMIRFAPRWRG